MDFKPRELEFYFYERIMENGNLHGLYKYYSHCKNQIHEYPDYGDLSERQVDENHDNYKNMEQTKKEICQLMFEIEDELKKNNSQWS